jgi:putative ATP-grasp target RiPP
MTSEAGPRRASVVRPWGLRDLQPAPPAEVPMYRYDPIRQVALTSGGELWGSTSTRARRSPRSPSWTAMRVAQRRSVGTTAKM